MKKIKYPADKDKLDRAYIAIFENSGSNWKTQQKEWEKIRNKNYILKNHFPIHLNKILIASYKKLTTYYNYYLSLSPIIQGIFNDKLENIFNYDYYQPIISLFFMNKENGFNITTCHYCDMAYINTYVTDFEKEGLHLINNVWSKTDFKNKLRLCDASTNFIYAQRPYHSIEEFNHLSCFRSHDKFHQIFKNHGLKNHFDLDHALDKGSCPIVALSLRNFVPSCQVCNEKLKRSRILGKHGVPIEHLSPTSPHYDFDGTVTIDLLPRNGTITGYPWDKPEDYMIVFNCHDQSYETIVDIFKLNERYDYHKSEAIYWLKMKHKYTDSNIKMIAQTLKEDSNFSEEKIKEDIFRIEEEQTHPHCFAKMKKDMLL